MKFNMEIDDINIEEFGKKFSETYSFLYEHTDVYDYVEEVRRCVALGYELSC